MAAVRELARGAGRGAAGTAVMSVPMLLRWAVRPEPPPPMVVAENLQRKLALEPSRHHPVLRHAVWVAAHLGFGMTVGAVAALWPKRAETSRSARRYGVAVWTAMYGITLPLSGLYPSLRRDNRLRAAETLLSHLVYAATLARVS